MYVSHERSPFGHQTACGLPWQQWQAPEEYADGAMGVLPGPVNPPGDQDVIDCSTCREHLPDLERRLEEGRQAVEETLATRVARQQGR